MDLLQKVSAIVFARLSGELRNFTEYPDLVLQYFELCARFVRSMPDKLMNNQLIHSIFQCAMAGLSVQQREASQSLLYFLEKLLRTGAVRFGLLACLLVAAGSRKVEAVQCLPCAVDRSWV